MSPIKTRNPQARVAASVSCPFCSAPAGYLYFNDGKLRRQIKCKVCSGLFQHTLRSPAREKTKFWCPHCKAALYLWKSKDCQTIYKCPNDKCPEYLRNKDKLNPLEVLVQSVKSSQFKLRYQYRDYHFSDEQLAHSEPQKFPDDHIFNVRRSLKDFCLALTFHVSLGISARQTAYILTNVFRMRTSYQTVLNYARYAAPFCHQFNLHFKEPAGPTQVGDETYIKIAGKNAYTFFFATPSNRAITAYHIDDSRGTLPATIAMNEALRTAPSDQPVDFITDGNNAYQAGIHYLNKARDSNAQITNTQVIGLQNLDSVSEEFRPFKQIIERLNRTYKHHVRAANGFNNKNGAVVITTLFVTFYNFIRPHTALRYKPPLTVPGMELAETIQDKWALILIKAFKL